MRFSEFFGTSPQFWLNVLAHYDLEMKRLTMEKELAAIKNVKELQVR